MNLDGLYIDEPRAYPASAVRGRAKRVTTREWSHFWCDPGCESALHVAALRIGCKRTWFQNKAGFPHYDLTPERQTRARRMGVQIITLRTWLRRREKDGPEPTRLMKALDDDAFEPDTEAPAEPYDD